ncbi:MAG: DEAD/DEAH box helicase, partial [Methermicoccaceae archaeon]
MSAFPLTLNIKPAYIPLRGEYRGMQLMEHQQAVLEAEEKLVVLDAPTSSGKTLAMLAKVLESGGNGLFLYPTNELIEDQASSLVKLLKRMG